MTEISPGSDPAGGAQAASGPDGAGSAGETDTGDGEATRSATTESSSGSKPAKRSGPMSFLKETAIVVVSALVLSLLIKTFLVQAYYIPSASMENTLDVGDKILVSRLVPSPLSLHRGDVIVFKDPGGWLSSTPEDSGNAFSQAVNDVLTFIGLRPQDSGQHLVKRVIGLPGDHVTCCTAQGRVTVNGTAIDESKYIRPGSVPSQTPFDKVVPQGMLFVMGDNRQDSADSRYNESKPGGGFVPIDNVVGTTFAVVWPLNHAKILRNPGSVFADVPDPKDTAPTPSGTTKQPSTTGSTK